jgi:glycosyltransferase involved in cell wall biosynthesis
VRRGHEVTLLGHPDSEVEEHGIRLIARPPGVEDWRSLVPESIDVIHLFYSPGLEFDKPVLVTIQGNGKPGERFHRNTVFVSRKHAENHGSDQFVYNGVDLDEYPFLEGRKAGWNDFLFLAKASWKVKNLSHCVRACRGSRKHLRIAGGRSWVPSRFVHSYDMVGQDVKLELLKRTNALLFPVRWHEPFGIAIIEAMAMGLPVMGSPYGSLPELIQPEVGRICGSYTEFSAAVAEAPAAFDARTIRHYVETRFSIRQTTDRYLELYGKLVAGETLNARVPQTVSQESPETLLAY